MTQTVSRPSEWCVDIPAGENMTPYLLPICQGNITMAKVLNELIFHASWPYCDSNFDKSANSITISRTHKKLLEKVGGAKQTLRTYLNELKTRGYTHFAPYSSEYTINRKAINEALAHPPQTFVRTHGSTFFQSQPKRKSAKCSKRSTSPKDDASSQLAHVANNNEASLEAMIEAKVLNVVNQVLNPATEVLNVALQRLNVALSTFSEQASQAVEQPKVLNLSLLPDSFPSFSDSFCDAAIAASPAKIREELDPFCEDLATSLLHSYSQSSPINETTTVSSCSSLPHPVPSAPSFIAHPTHSWLFIDSLQAPTTMVITTSSEPWALSHEDKQRGKVAKSLAEQWKLQGCTLNVVLEQRRTPVEVGPGIVGTRSMPIGNINANTSIETETEKKKSAGGKANKAAVQGTLIPAVLVPQTDAFKVAKEEEDRRASALYQRITTEWRGYKLASAGKCIDEQRKCRTLVQTYSDQDIADFRTYMLTEMYRYQQEDQKYKLGAYAILDEAEAIARVFKDREERGEPRIQPKEKRGAGTRRSTASFQPSVMEEPDTFANVPDYGGQTREQVLADLENDIAYLREQGIAI